MSQKAEELYYQSKIEVNSKLQRYELNTHTLRIGLKRQNNERKAANIFVDSTEMEVTLKAVLVLEQSTAQKLLDLVVEKDDEILSLKSTPQK